MKIKTKDITVCAAIVALMIVMGWMPWVFLVPLLFAACTQKTPIALFCGFAYGCISLLYAYLGAVTPVGLAFLQQPWIPIVPRILVGLFTCLSFVGFRKLFKGNGKVQRALPYNLAASVGVLTNTVLVVLCLVLFVPSIQVPDGLIQYMYLLIPEMIISFMFEMTFANLIVPTLCLTAGKALRLGEFAPKTKPAESIAAEKLS